MCNRRRICLRLSSVSIRLLQIRFDLKHFTIYVLAFAELHFVRQTHPFSLAGVQYEKRVSEKEILIASKRSRSFNLQDDATFSEKKINDDTDRSLSKRPKTIQH